MVPRERDEAAEQSASFINIADMVSERALHGWSS
jgi:hypothetical protein